MKQPDPCKWTDDQTRIWNAIQIWEAIRHNPGCSFPDTCDYQTACELEVVGVVESRTHDDGDDTWHVAVHNIMENV